MNKVVLKILIIWLFSINVSAQKISVIKSFDTRDFIDLSKPLELSQIASLDIDTLRILRNEIFARHGYQFKSNYLQEYFSELDWYLPVSGNFTAEQSLNTTDKLNINLIKSVENSKKNKRQKEFKEFTMNISFVDLPFEYDCDSIQPSNPNHSEITSSFIPLGAQVVGKLYNSCNRTAIIYFFVGDFFYSYTYIYNEFGQIIDRISMLNSCGYDAGYISKTEGKITLDYKLIMKHILITWDFEKENSTRDSVININQIKLK